ncbi:MAG: hypothetical protein ACKVP5_23865 [Aestuariivirga sp.]
MSDVWRGISSATNPMTKNRTMPGAIDLDELQRLKLMQDMQKELVGWAKSRLAPLSMVMVVLSFFGLKTMFDQNIASMVSSKVDGPLNRQVVKMEDANYEAAKKIGQLAVASEFLTKAANDTMHAADEARKNANEAAATGKEVQERFAKLQLEIAGNVDNRMRIAEAALDRASRYITGLSRSLFEKSRQQSLTGTLFEERIVALEKKQSELAAAFAEVLQNDPGQAHALIIRFQEIDQQYRDSITRINKRNAVSVILMVGKGEASEKAAQLAEQYLQSSGYFATVYFPYGKSKTEKIGDIEKDFAGLTIDNGMNGGPVIFINGRLAERDFYGADLRSVFEAKGIGPAKVVSATFLPADQYLRRTDDERFDPSNVIVCYFPLSDSSG